MCEKREIPSDENIPSRTSCSENEALKTFLKFLAFTAEFARENLFFRTI